jgi:hypothetical protein
LRNVLIKGTRKGFPKIFVKQRLIEQKDLRVDRDSGKEIEEQRKTI